MKQILVMCAVAIAASCFTSCETNNKGKLLDPNAKISIKPAPAPAGVAVRTAYLSPVEVVRLTTDIAMQSKLAPNEPYINYGISDEQRDLTTPKIMMWGMWVMMDGKLTPDFIEAAYDVVFVKQQVVGGERKITDTLAYIPNATLRTAETAIKAAYALEDYELVYTLFDQAYQFTPINGADWRALKAKNEN